MPLIKILWIKNYKFADTLEANFKAVFLELYNSVYNAFFKNDINGRFQRIALKFSTMQHVTLGKVLNQKNLKNVVETFLYFFFDTTLFSKNC